MPGLMHNLWARFYSNVLLPDRTSVYADLLAGLKAHEFQSMTMLDFAQRRSSGGVMPDRVVLLRHDIDTDPAYTPRWIAAEKAAGFVSTSYFRLRTLDLAMMRAINEGGGEASYHFEEIASYAKQHGLRSPDAVQAAMPLIQKRFADNVRNLRARSGLPILTVASHGDFANRSLGMTNTALLSPPLMQELGIVAETYGSLIQDGVNYRVSDQHYPKEWRFTGIDSFDSAFKAPKLVIEILTHPRHWRASLMANVREDSDRMLSSVMYRSGISSGRYMDFADRRADI